MTFTMLTPKVNLAPTQSPLSKMESSFVPFPLTLWCRNIFLKVVSNFTMKMIGKS